MTYLSLIDFLNIDKKNKIIQLVGINFIFT